MQAPVSAPRNDSLTSYRDIAANRTTVARATTWRFGEVAEFPSSSLEGEAAQPVGRYVGSYVAYRTGVYEVKSGSTTLVRQFELLFHVFKHTVSQWSVLILRISCTFALSARTCFLNTSHCVRYQP